MAAATELTELHDRMNIEVKKLQDIHTARYSRKYSTRSACLKKEVGIGTYCVYANRMQTK